MKTAFVPSEMVVAQALKQGFPEFLLDTTTDCEAKKFILDHAQSDRMPGIAMAA